MYTYLILNGVTVLIPLLLSFERRVCYVKKWKYLFPALGVSACIFLAWDYLFTHWNIWGFNPQYLTGIYLLNLPLEEVLFFFCIPFSCVFIYEVILYFKKKPVSTSVTYPVTFLLMIVSLIIGVSHISRRYTAVTFIALAAFLAIHLFFIRPTYLGYFYIMYLVSIVPFSIINGILTRGLASIDTGPVVWYNNGHNLSLRIGTIPVEDFFYSFLLLLTVVTFYEYFKKILKEKRNEAS